MPEVRRPIASGHMWAPPGAPLAGINLPATVLSPVIDAGAPLRLGVVAATWDGLDV